MRIISIPVLILFLLLPVDAHRSFEKKILRSEDKMRRDETQTSSHLECTHVSKEQNKNEAKKMIFSLLQYKVMLAWSLFRPLSTFEFVVFIVYEQI